MSDPGKQDWELIARNIVAILKKEQKRVRDQLDFDLRIIGRHTVDNQEVPPSLLSEARQLESYQNGIQFGLTTGVGFLTGQLIPTPLSSLTDK